MTIPMGAVVPLFLAAFVLFIVMYYRTNLERRILNPYFLLTAGAIMMVFVEIIATVGNFDVSRLNLVLFPLGLVWLAIAIVMWRRMPVKKKR